MLLVKNNIAATEHPLASLAAHRVMKEGGNAFDAATAASFALTVLQPHLNSIGGDFFGLLYNAKDGKVHCLNSSGWSPASLTVEEVHHRGLDSVPRFGPMSVTVPGYVKGVYEMQRRFGALDFPGLLDQAIEFAEEGFPIGTGLVKALEINQERLPEEARRKFLPGGKIPVAGTRLKQSELGSCLREIAGDGPGAFYDGTPARAISKELSSGGVQMTESDFLDFSPEWCEPLRADYRGVGVYEIPPNSMGATTLLILKLLRETNVGRYEANSARRIDLTIEAVRAAYASRDKELGDPRFTKFDLQSFLGSKEGITRQKRIDEADTTYFAIADRDGNILSCIQSIFHHFGSRIYVDKCGFFLNNRGSSFGMEGPNKIEPRKRPLHTLSSLILEGEHGPFAALGCSGGDYRPQQHALFVTNMLDYSMDLEKSLNYPRFLWDGQDTVRIEQGYTGLDGLSFKKEVVVYPGATGVAQGVEKREGGVMGICDVRGEGRPMGS